METDLKLLMFCFFGGKMYYPCEIVVRYILPLFRSMVAKILVERYKFTQGETGDNAGCYKSISI